MTHWYVEKKREHFYKEAKRVGYRARSAFKLQQIQQRYHIIPKNATVVDLGAAPGGWSQIAAELAGEKGTVIAADISLMKPLKNVLCIQGDIAEPGTVERIKQPLEAKKADVVLSDMSPNISGNYNVDQARSAWLCECALDVATQILKPGGNFVCKIFEGEDTKEFLEKVKPHFTLVRIFSPEASRKSSSEVYIIAKTYKKIS